jgi:hypothetical protein
MQIFSVLYEEYSHHGILKHVLIFVSKLVKTAVSGKKTFLQFYSANMKTKSKCLQECCECAD